MRYYEVLPADARYRSDAPLTYSFDGSLPVHSAVSIPMQQRIITGFVLGEVAKPTFPTKNIKSSISARPLPEHCWKAAEWIREYYHVGLPEAIRQFAPSRPSVRKQEPFTDTAPIDQLEWSAPVTEEQSNAIKAIGNSKSTTILLHGETGSGKTRVYLELASRSLSGGKSVLLLTPEISLTPQLAQSAKKMLEAPVFILHSQLTQSERKKIWLKLLESNEPVVVVGPRSALFSPVANIGLIVVDESHEPAYKQEQSPRYHAVRLASRLGEIAGAKVVLGSATPNITDYYLAGQRDAVVRMEKPAIRGAEAATIKLVDLKDRSQFSRSRHLSKIMLDEIATTLQAKKQVLIYLNRRGSARLIMCHQCGWQLICPNCDIALTYHGDEHTARCHICGHRQQPPTTCPQCQNPDIIYKSIGTKALAEELRRLFPDAKINRFDSDSEQGERLHESFESITSGKADILVGTQLLAKGLDLPKLGLVGIVSAETSLALPDFSSEERSYQLLYQVIGRVGRGHGKSSVVIQSYEPDADFLKSVVKKDWAAFYQHTIAERRQFKFPPFSYLMQLTIRRGTIKGAETAAEKLKAKITDLGLPVEVSGPSPSFYQRRGRFYFYQLVVKAKRRNDLLKIADAVPSDWIIDLDPVDLL